MQEVSASPPCQGLDEQSRRLAVKVRVYLLWGDKVKHILRATSPLAEAGLPFSEGVIRDHLSKHRLTLCKRAEALSLA